MGHHEMELDYDGSFAFEDLETKTIRQVDTKSQQREYVERVIQWLKQSRLWMYERQITYQLIKLNDPFEKTLRDFLKVRKTLIR
jgi:hypothetical protein